MKVWSATSRGAYPCGILPCFESRRVFRTLGTPSAIEHFLLEYDISTRSCCHLLRFISAEAAFPLGCQCRATALPRRVYQTLGTTRTIEHFLLEYDVTMRSCCHLLRFISAEAASD